MRLVRPEIADQLKSCPVFPAEPPPLETVGDIYAAAVEALAGWHECGWKLRAVVAELEHVPAAPPAP